jgi:hypothetical protein
MLLKRLGHDIKKRRRKRGKSEMRRERNEQVFY